MLEIDANELNNVFASQDFIIFKIGKIGNYLGSSKYDVQANVDKVVFLYTLVQAAKFSRCCFSK